MSVRRKAVAAAVVAAASFTSAAAPGDAAPFLPLGYGNWGPSTAVAGTCGSAVWAGSTTCGVQASSAFTGPAGRIIETCANATYVVTSPVIIGTNFGCHIEFSATLQAAGAGGSTGQISEDVVIEVGACAGLAISGAQIAVTDNAAGTYVVYPKIVVTNAGWKMQGNLVAVNASTTTVVVLNVVGTITPGCKKVRARNGETYVTFTGIFKGNYQFL